MAVVKYNVYYRFINPNTQKAITNSNMNENYDKLKYISSYSARDNSKEQAEDVTINNDPKNEKYNMIFYYNGTENINHKIKHSLTIPNDEIIVNGDCFGQCVGSPWFLYGSKPSFKAALELGKELVGKVGKENVRICKEVPLKEYVDVE